MSSHFRNKSRKHSTFISTQRQPFEAGGVRVSVLEDETTSMIEYVFIRNLSLVMFLARRLDAVLSFLGQCSSRAD